MLGFATTIFLVILSTSCALEIKYGGPVAFSFPCNDNPRYLTQEFRVTETNSSEWKGTFYVDQWVNSVNVKLDFVFDAPATVEANRRLIHIIDLDSEGQKSFRLTTLQPLNKTNRVEFKVFGVTDKLPNLLSLNVNGQTLCDNKDRATNVELIQGLTNEATVADAVKKRCGIRHPVLAETKHLIDWPWKISLYYNESEDGRFALLCGGTLIGENKVMTAGNCLKNREAGRLLVEVGQRNVTVKEFKLHIAFMANTLNNDVAVMEIEAVTDAKEQRFPICLYSDWAAPRNNVTTGAIDRETQQFQSLKVEDSLLCLENNRMEYGNYLSTKNFCTKTESDETKILRGDGFYEEFFDQERNTFNWKLKGVASFVTKKPFYIFTDVSKYYTWIESNL